jgi:molybdopterin-guanine dinucleotide biosynthesis adapter protein
MRIIGITGWSGSGKTTLILKLVPLLKAKGLSVSTLKHAHHMFDVDRPGKDSHEHRAAGAQEVLIASANRFALMHELRGAPEPTLPVLLQRLSPVDLVLIEGYKQAAHPKLEVSRQANGKPFLFADIPNVRAVISDHVPEACPVPHLGLNDLVGVLSAIETHAMRPDDIPWTTGS